VRAPGNGDPLLGALDALLGLAGDDDPAALRPVIWLVRTAKRLQSGRADAYLAYMLIALVARLALVTALA
jgi:hypothetical protein